MAGSPAGASAKPQAGLNRRDLAELAAGVLVLAAVLTVVRFTVPGPVRAYYFGWPNGAVWPNLAASLIGAVLIWWRIRTRLIAHHAQVMAQAARHHKASMAQAQAHHEALKAHVAAVTPGHAAVGEAVAAERARVLGHAAEQFGSAAASRLAARVTTEGTEP